MLAYSLHAYNSLLAYLHLHTLTLALHALHFTAFALPLTQGYV